MTGGQRAEIEAALKMLGRGPGGGLISPADASQPSLYVPSESEDIDLK